MDITMVSLSIAASPAADGRSRTNVATRPARAVAGTTDRGRHPDSGALDALLRGLADPEHSIELVPQAIALLADDRLAPEVTRALRKSGPQVLDPLVTALLDPERPVEVRRRIPRILGALHDARAVKALLAGLDDVRFQVRLQCGRALAHLRDAVPGMSIDPERVLGAVLREVDIEKHVWGGRREMEQLEDPGDTPLVEAYVRERASASLQHIFTLLSTALPERSLLRLAFHALHGDDARRHGTALEYLDSVLPPKVKEALWPFLEERGRTSRPTRTREEIVADLTLTSESMAIHIAELRRPEHGE